MARQLTRLLAGWIVLLSACGFARAWSIDEARAACIAKVRPTVVACVRSHMAANGGPPMAYVAQCREPVIPRVRTCIFQTLADAGHPALTNRPLPGVAEICPLGFQGCLNRCHYIGGIGGTTSAKGCGRVCAIRCRGKGEHGVGAITPPDEDAAAMMLSANGADSY